MTALSTPDIWTAWEEGTITDQEALNALCVDLGEVESELAPLEHERKLLRSRLERITLHAGGRAAVAGFGQLAVTEPTTVVGYDAKALDALIARLVGEGQIDTAEQIAACRTETRRAGYLRIVRS